eukprot:CAMPEP_0172692832 /NCGR_PEP_ID=MMETSP1074-20121228/25541_1 /TAXON_ID=2916 /ORGANISM="Ceratium fusus, Strain PA161109" /LENGTH=417 /DNA_ID=CAMNT_0013513099 /DNA_START=40 /DNA_END=1290 /DNA_ORIENTATION=-
MAFYRKLAQHSLRRFASQASRHLPKPVPMKADVGPIFGLGAITLGAAAWYLHKSSVRPPALFSFGVITDIQYADIDDKGKRGKVRYYRNALNVVDNAVRWWRAGPPLAFVLHAGDIIDGACAYEGLRTSKTALGKVMQRLDIGCLLIGLIGNHELYNFSRAELRTGVHEQLHLTDGAGSFYYRFAPPAVESAGWRLLVVDPFEISVLSGGYGMGLHRESLEMLCNHNSNFRELLSTKPQTDSLAGLDECDWFKGMPRKQEPGDVARRWTPLNGAMSERQMKWIADELREATCLGINVGILSHVILRPEVANPDCLLWNYEDFLRIVDDAELGSCVKLYICGHQHEGGFFKDDRGAYHCVFESPLLSKPGDPGAFARIDVLKDAVRVVGYSPALTPEQEFDARGHVLTKDCNPFTLCE